MDSLLILGRQPQLGLAELESLYGSDKLLPLTRHSVILKVDPCLVAFDRLGGSLKFAKVLTELKTTDWPAIEQFLAEAAPLQAQKLPAGRLKLGLSLYGFDLNPKAITASG